MVEEVRDFELVDVRAVENILENDEEVSNKSASTMLINGVENGDDVQLQHDIDSLLTQTEMILASENVSIPFQN